MRLEGFVEATGLRQQSELEKVRLLAFYFAKTEGLAEFSLANIENWFDRLNLPKPNRTRLRRKMAQSRQFLGGEKATSFRLHGSETTDLERQFPIDNDDIISTNFVLAENLYQGTRGYVVKLCEQVNCSYEQKVFDGCAVLMRRLMEILLILSYRALGLEGDIRTTDGSYVNLDRLIALTDTKLPLTKGSRAVAERVRELGNLSAHRVEFNCRRTDIEPHLLAYRVLIEELLYKSGLRT